MRRVHDGELWLDMDALVNIRREIINIIMDLSIQGKQCPLKDSKMIELRKIIKTTLGKRDMMVDKVKHKGTRFVVMIT